MNQRGKQVLALLLAVEMAAAVLFSGGAIYAAEEKSVSFDNAAEQSVQADMAAAELGISTLALPNATAGAPYSVTMAVYGGQAPYTYAAAGLPAGLSIHSSTGEITGMPEQASEQAYDVELIVQDAAEAAHTAKAHVQLKVNPQSTQPLEDKIKVEEIAHYAVGASSKDGGVAEIIKYNKDNGKFYLVNGSSTPASLDVVTLQASGELQREKQIRIEELVNDSSFTYGDLTSVDVNTAADRIAAAVQEADPAKPGKIVVLDYEGNLIHTYESGVQPDMVTFTSDGRYILSADEGEPRADVDPEGSVTIVDTLTNEVAKIRFNQPERIDDNVHVRGLPNADGQIMGKGSKSDAVHDLEPEFISLSKDEKTAYVALQENNAIAVIDIATKTVTGVHGLGYKSFNEAGNELDLIKDGKIQFENVPFYGMYMPDGIAAYEVNGQTYLLSANEGDATGWSDRTNESKIKDMKAMLAQDSEAAIFLADKGTVYDKVEVASDMGADGLYLYGARSFSIWKAQDMSLVYDSGSDFEKITAERLPEVFNTSNDKKELDSRSAKKGPEPEYVTVGQVGDKTLAFIGLERIGGVMTYDVTNPMGPVFLNYINTRDFDAGIASDSAPEGLEFIGAEDSPTGRPLLLVANEVSGTVAVLELKVSKVTLDRSTLELRTGSDPVQLHADVEPATGKGVGVKWTSSNPAAASVDQQGRVFPHAAGEAIITAGSEDGYGAAQVRVTVESGSGEEPWKLTVMHTNDTHAHLGDVARRATLVNQVRSEGGNQLLLDAGDVFSGDLYFTKWMGLADLAFMNMMGYDAMTFGNHEFDQGTQVLAAFISKAKFPMVSSNIDLSKDRYLSKLIKEPTAFQSNAPKTVERAGVYPYITVELDGRKVGVFGLTTEDTAETSSPGKDVAFHDAIESARQTVDAMEKEGLDIIIGVTHIGYARDKQLAEAVEGIDLLVGGHTHTTLNAPEIVVDPQYQTPTVIVQANEWGKYLGRVDLAFNSQGVVMIEEINGKLIPVDSKVEENPEAKAVLDPYKAELQEMMNEVVGSSSVQLDGERKNVRSKETNLGNLIADGMLAKAKELKQADIALMNGGGIRASIDQGEITMGELRTVMPFGNTLFVLDMTGKQLKEGLENGISGAKLDDLPGKFPQVAGMTFKWDPKQPIGERVHDVRIKKGSGYVPLDLAATYRVATNSFVAKGGDGYRSFAEAIEQGRYNEDLGYPDYEIFIEHIARLGGIVSPTVDGRIKEQAKPQPGGGDDNGNGSGSGSGGGTGTAPTDSESSPANVLTSKQWQLASVKNEAGEVVHQITVLDEVLKKAAASLHAKQQEIVIRAEKLDGRVEVMLPAAIVASAAEKIKGATLVIETKLASYQLPIEALPLAKLKQDGRLEQAKLLLSMDKASAQVMDKLSAEVQSSGVKLVGGHAAAFALSIVLDKNTQEIKDFERQYVSRIIPLPEGVASSPITAVKVNEETGRFHFVPAVHTTLNGNPAMMIKHTGNGVFALIQHRASFTDLNGHWAKAEVELLASKWLFKGKSSSVFAPNEAITRGEYTALLIRALGLAPAADAATFADVNAQHPYAGEIAAAERLGILEGATGTRFRPEASMTRAEMAVMTARALQAAAAEAKAKADLDSFKDASTVPAWAVDAMSQLVELGILEGDHKGRLTPNNSVTRAQSALVMSRMLKELMFID